MTSRRVRPRPDEAFGFAAAAADDRVLPRKSASHGEAGFARRAFDFYPTEPWVTRALVAAVDFRLADQAAPALIWEAACGDGRMAKELEAAGYRVAASDIADHGHGRTGIDFLARGSAAAAGALEAVAIVTNPPFDLAVSFVAHALELMRDCRGKVAIVQRHEWDAAAERHALFAGAPFRCKLVLPRRPRWADDGGGAPRFPFAWYLWDWSSPGPGPTLFLPDPDKRPAAGGDLFR